MTITDITTTRAEQISADKPVAVLYSQPGCGPCIGLERALKSAGAAYNKIDITQDADALARVRSLGYSGTPVIEIHQDGQLIDHWHGLDIHRVAQHFPKEVA
ncbi:glutaredoxin family protein [Citricoccus sp. NR2]|uniref:glutaredoxin family protein n=1 Tax=Citricoccus sp. NR2 TaxID=3004095 RepID=UPI0022DD9F3C|nr:glutaredoxin family protein [Citricoccus sp. NR2]WBL18481.1 glutaredoxin family protein [Citricoccus sp. NR2]